MFTYISDGFRYYTRTYQRYSIEYWENLGPQDYAILLILVMAFGYLLMKSSR